MDLREYIFRKRLTVISFAESIGYHRNSISSIISGRKKPGRGLARAIEDRTNKEVTIKEMMTPQKDEMND